MSPLTYSASFAMFSHMRLLCQLDVPFYVDNYTLLKCSEGNMVAGG